MSSANCLPRSFLGSRLGDFEIGHQQAQPIAFRALFWSHGFGDFEFADTTRSANCLPMSFWAHRLEDSRNSVQQAQPIAFRGLFWAHGFVDIGFEVQRAQRVAFRGLFWAHSFVLFAFGKEPAQPVAFRGLFWAHGFEGFVLEWQQAWIIADTLCRAKCELCSLCVHLVAIRFVLECADMGDVVVSGRMLAANSKPHPRIDLIAHCIAEGIKRHSI